MIPHPDERPLITVDELLEAVPGWPGGRSATYEAVRRGELPSVRIGRRLFIVTSALRQLLWLGEAAAGPQTRKNEAPDSTNEAPFISRASSDRQVRRERYGG